MALSTAPGSPDPASTVLPARLSTPVRVKLGLSDAGSSGGGGGGAIRSDSRTRSASDGVCRRSDDVLGCVEGGRTCWKVRGERVRSKGGTDEVETDVTGVRVEEKSPVREPINEEQSGSEDEDTLPIAEEEYVHITQVALEPGSSPKKPTTLYIEVGGTKYALGTLEQGRCEQFSLDVVVDESFELSLSGKGVVSVTGYRTLLRDMSLFDEYDSEDEDEDVEDESEEEEEEEEEPKAANNKGTKQLKKDEEEEEDSESEEEDEAPVTGKSKAGKKFEKAMLEKAQKKVAKETKQAKDAYDSGSDEEEDSEDDEEAGVEGKEFSDMDTSGEESEEDSEEEEEEAPPKKPAAAAKGSKRTAPDTPQPSAKKAKASASTPAKTPSKTPGKTPTNTPAKTPASTGATPSKSPKSVSAALKSSIEKTLKSKGKPIDMSAFGKEYEQVVGKKLDLKVEGFRKLRDLIDSVPDVATIRDDGGRLTVASP